MRREDVVGDAGGGQCEVAGNELGDLDGDCSDHAEVRDKRETRDLIADSRTHCPNSEPVKATGSFVAHRKMRENVGRQQKDDAAAQPGEPARRAGDRCHERDGRTHHCARGNLGNGLCHDLEAGQGTSAKHRGALVSLHRAVPPKDLNWLIRAHTASGANASSYWYSSGRRSAKR